MDIQSAKLTRVQHSYLVAAHECDSINNDQRLRLQVLLRLERMGLLEIFDMEAAIYSKRKIIYHFTLTEQGKKILGAQS